MKTTKEERGRIETKNASSNADRKIPELYVHTEKTKMRGKGRMRLIN